MSNKIQSYIDNINNDYLQDKPYKIISIDDFKSSRSRCSMHCEIHGNGDDWGNPWNPTIKKLKTDRGCPKCADRYTFTEAEILQRTNSLIKDKNIQIHKIIDYKNTSSRCVMHCSTHGKSDSWDRPWLPRIKDLNYGSGCPQCAHELKDLSKLLKMPTEEQLNTKTKLYLVGFSGVESFSKIGITVQSISERFKSCNLQRANLTLKEHLVIELKTVTALLLEYHLLVKFAKFKSNQPILNEFQIGGATECFSNDLLKHIDIKSELSFILNNKEIIVDEFLSHKPKLVQHRTLILSQLNNK